VNLWKFFLCPGTLARLSVMEPLHVAAVLLNCEHDDMEGCINLTD
jgi:hypothetical protein